MINNIKDRHLKVLESLSVYKYLVVSQFIKLGVGKNRHYLNPILRELQKGKKPLIGELRFGVLPRFGKLQYVYYLTKYGVEFLIDNLNLTLSEINYPVGTATFFNRDYFHRIACIDFQIAFRLWTDSKGISIDFYHNYYDKTGSNRKDGSKSHVKTKIDIDSDRFIIPDSICQLSKRNKKVLFLFEQHNGKDSKKFMRQLLQHALTIFNESVNKKYDTQKDSRVYCVFEFPKIMQACMKRIVEDDTFHVYRNHFLFKTSEAVKRDFFSGWLSCDGRVLDFLGKTTHHERKI